MLKKVSVPTLLVALAGLWAVHNVSVLAPAKNMLYGTKAA